MGVFATYSNLMTYILPIICSAICSVFTFFLIWNYRNLAERKLRRVVSIYCILIAVWWSSFLWHARADDPVFLPVDIPFALSYIYIPILFYNIVYYLTYLGDQRNFPVLNYLWPVPTLVIILIATTWISPPKEGIFTGLSPFERYTELFISGLLLRFITAVAYIVPTGLLLSRYYKQTVADRVFTFVGRRKPMAYLAERVMHYGSGNIAYLPGYPQTISLLQNLLFVSGQRKESREQQLDRQTASCAGQHAWTVEQEGVRKLFFSTKTISQS